MSSKRKSISVSASALGAVLLMGCGPEASTTPSGSTTVTSKPSGSVKTASGSAKPSSTPAPSTSGSAAPTTSAAAPPSVKPKSIEANAASEFEFEGHKIALSSLEFHLYPGPGGKYFAGAPTTMRSSVLNAPFRDKLKTTDFPDSATLVEIEPFKYAKGEHIKGKVVLDYANKDVASKGSAVFDAEICDDSAPKGKGVAESAPNGPISGTIGGKPFAGKKVFAKTGTLDDGKTKAITSLYVVQGEATCEDYDKQQNRLWISAFGAANEKQNLTGAPVWFYLHFIDDSQRDYNKGKYELGQTWLSFDNLSYEKGAVIKGSLVANLPDDDKAPAADIGGHFEATICN